MLEHIKRELRVQGGVVRPRKIMVAQYAWESKSTAEPPTKYLKFAKGARIEVITERQTSGWWAGKLDGRIGWFPSTFCKVEAAEPAVPAAASDAASGTQLLHLREPSGEPASSSDDELSCPTCLDTLCDPVTCCPCGHSFCCECLEAWLDRGRHTCPLCSTRIQHAALSFSLKAIVERGHAESLRARRVACGWAERRSYSRAFEQEHAAATLLSQLLPARLARALMTLFDQRLAVGGRVGVKLLVVAWAAIFCLFFIYFLVLFVAPPENAAATDLLPFDAMALLRSVNLAGLPSLVATVFCITFAFFFVGLMFFA